MHSLTWLWLSALVLLSWGVLGVLQKMATNHITPQTAMMWAAAGFMLLQPILFPSGLVFDYSAANLGWALLNGIFNGLGFLSLMAAMHKGGKASIVEPLSAALYPVLFVLLAPVLLRETLKPMQALGILCAVTSAILLCAERQSG
jgi:bacterial/archaeal transporter family protein